MHVKTAILGYLMETPLMKVELKRAFVRGGDLSVMKDGQLKMLKWCVLNLDSVQQVPLRTPNPIIFCLQT